MDKYLIQFYYDEKEKEFHDLAMGALTMEKYVKRFTSLLWYVWYMKEEKAKIQHFISSLPKFMKENMEFDYPKVMDNIVWKACICYQQMKQKSEGLKGGLNQRGRNFPQTDRQKFPAKEVYSKPFSNFPARNQPKVPTPTKNR